VIILFHIKEGKLEPKISDKESYRENIIKFLADYYGQRIHRISAMK
jgi:hypothetical protein